MDPTERFARLVSKPEREIALDEANLLIAAHAYPDLDVDAQLGRIDALAPRCHAPTLDALLELLFIDEGFVGNTTRYFDPRNSFLNDVLDRHTGIPISLGILTVAVGRRVGVPLDSVSMPGHFLLRDKVDPAVFVDPFARGAVLDVSGCARAFHAVHGDDAEFDVAFLEPVGAHAVIARMLANLRSVYAASEDRAALAWVLRLRSLVPGTPAEERGELASVLVAAGRFAEAADELDALAVALGGELGEEYRTQASRLRARLN